MARQKRFRRIVGYLVAKLSQLALEEVEDPRSHQGRRWQLKQVLAICLLGVMAGCKNLSEVERLTQKLARPLRRRLGVPRRLPDTTARDLLCRLSTQKLTPLLHQAVALAQRSKSLERSGLPFHMVAMDGKWTALPRWEGIYAQKQNPQDGAPYGMVRTVTSVLASTQSRPCIDLSPIPAITNEMGHFPNAFDALCNHYGRLFRLVSYDQGANSEENARHVLEQGKDYLFRLNDERRHMQQLAMELLSYQEVVAETHDVTSNREEVYRRLRIFHLNCGILPKLPRKSELWSHTKTLLAVESETQKDGVRKNIETRYYASSLSANTLTARQWLACVRYHWRVELAHQCLDKSFAEDERPWIKNDANGMLVVLALRRIGYTLLSLYRTVTQRSDENREMSWNELFEWIRDALIASSEATVASLRLRKGFPKLIIAAAA